jgi:hypothetical protein
LDIVREEQELASHQIELIVVDREHDEHSILVVTGTKFTVKPWDEEKNVQFFIYDQTRHQEFLNNLAEYLQQLDHKTTYDDLWDASNSETIATLGLLGSSKGKPMYSVNVDGETPEIAYLQKAPVLE